MSAALDQPPISTCYSCMTQTGLHNLSTLPGLCAVHVYVHVHAGLCVRSLVPTIKSTMSCMVLLDTPQV